MPDSRIARSARPLARKPGCVAFLVRRGAADVDELLDASLFRGVEQRDGAAVVDALEGQSLLRILDRIAFELNRADDRVALR